MCVSKCVRGGCIYLCMSVCVSTVVSWTPQQHHCNINSNRDKCIKGTVASVMYATIVVYHNIISIITTLQQHHIITVALQQHYISITTISTATSRATLFMDLVNRWPHHPRIKRFRDSVSSRILWEQSRYSIRWTKSVSDVRIALRTRRTRVLNP